MGMGIMITAPTPFNIQVFKILVSIMRMDKIFLPYSLRCEYYSMVSTRPDFLAIPNLRLLKDDKSFIWIQNSVTPNRLTIHGFDFE